MAANILGRYHIIREIARSNDIVYEAMDPAQGKKIALKELQIPQNLVGQARHERIQRFTREARSAARLKHTNIVRIFDHGQIGSRHYIAMEFLQGQSLRDVLRQRGVMPLQEALRIAGAVANGLDFAHKNGVVHRDIKPDNVHLEPDGRVVITDFGIARLTFEPTLTADGQIFGTPSYMSPEQVTGKGIDKRTDIFSLGVMLYEMVAGRKPFTGDSVITITYNIMNVDPAPMAGAPPAVEQIIRRAIAKDPARRYQSAAELEEDLQLVARGASPRHATAMPPAASPAYANRSNGSGSGARPQPAPPSYPTPQPNVGRPMPRPVFGAGQGGGSGARPVGPMPGARPLPPSPWAGAHGSGPQNGRSGPPPVQPWGAAPSGQPPQPAWGTPATGYPQQPAGYAPPQGVPQNLPAPRRHAQREGGFDAGWFLGWIALAVVIAGIILTVVWASVTAYDRFRQDSVSVNATRTQQTATDAYKQGKYEEALNGYLAALKQVPNSQAAIIRSNAARSAVEVARQKITAGKGADAQRYAQQALELNPNSASAYVALGRALALQGDVDRAVASFDRGAEAAARAQSAQSPEGDKKEAKEAADTLPLWKADVLYRDGVSQMAKNPMLAEQRFQAVLLAAPNSQYAKNSRIQLQQLSYGIRGAAAGTPSDPAAAPAASPLTPAGNTQPPPVDLPAAARGWDNSYRNALPSASGPGGGN